MRKKLKKVGMLIFHRIIMKKSGKVLEGVGEMGEEKKVLFRDILGIVAILF